MSAETQAPPKKRGLLVAVAIAFALGALGAAALLVNIAERKQEAKNAYVKLVQVTENDVDPAKWGTNWPREYDGYKRTSEPSNTKYGGGTGGAEGTSRPEGGARPVAEPDLRGVPLRGRLPRPARPRLHAVRPGEHEAQRAGRGQAVGQLPALPRLDHAALPEAREGSGAAGERGRAAPEGPRGGRRHGLLGRAQEARAAHRRQGPPGLLRRLPRPRLDGAAHHAAGLHRGDPEARRLKGDAAHLPSIERWRKGDRARPYDPNVDATRQEKRSYVCGQCHVEYFCGKGTTIFFPWAEGLKVEEMERLYDGMQVKGARFKDWTHAETGMEVLKAQHPEFEMWSQGSTPGAASPARTATCPTGATAPRRSRSTG